MSIRGKLCVCVCQGHFVRSLGSAGEKETEEAVLLLEHDVPHQAFSQAVLSFLPKMPWTITPEVTFSGEHCSSLFIFCGSVYGWM